jgi:simple sugar transport system ATP-binding protein
VVTTLSGGNIQRVMLVRALGAPATLVVAAYPCRGLDIASTRRTQELLLEQRAQGAGVLLISEDLDELLELSDRLAVLHGGRIAGILDPATADRYEIGRLMLEGTH